MSNFAVAALVVALALTASAFVLPSDNGLSGLPYDGCDSTVGCLGLPDTACVAAKSCDTLLTYAKGSNAGTVDLVIYSQNASDTSDGKAHYVSVGINTIANMSQSTILNCINKADGGIALNPTYAKEHKPPVAIDLPELVASAATLSNNLLQCKFSIKTSVSTNGQNYDLTKPTYLLLAGGLADGKKNTVQYHDEYKVLTPEPVIPSQFPKAN